MSKEKALWIIPVLAFVGAALWLPNPEIVFMVAVGMVCGSLVLVMTFAIMTDK